MAITYATVFGILGKYVKYANTYYTLGLTTLSTDRNAIETILSASSQWDLVEGLNSVYDGWRDVAVGWANLLGQKSQAIFLDPDMVTVNLAALSSNPTIQQLFDELWKDMVANSQTIKRSTVTIGTVTAFGSPTGTPQIMTTKILDGYNRPSNDMSAYANYLGTDSELCQTSETMVLQAISDKYSGGVEGSELFSFTGGPRFRSPFDWRNSGSGPGPTVQVGNGRGLIQNGEFELFTTANTPDSWTMSTGATPGTTILDEASSVKRGSHALAFLGTGAAATIRITQAPATLIPLRSYCVGMWVLGDATIAGGSEFVAQFSGTSYTPGATEKIDLNQAALAALTSYTWKYFFVNMPAVIPTDLVLELKAIGTLTNAKKIRVDGLMMTEVVWHGGLGVAIGAGGTPVVKGDRWTFTVANNDTGVFQTFLKKVFRVQLPSAGSPSQSDTLAT